MFIPDNNTFDSQLLIEKTFPCNYGFDSQTRHYGFGYRVDSIQAKQYSGHCK